jgi:hypothetical protein
MPFHMQLFLNHRDRGFSLLGVAGTAFQCALPGAGLAALVMVSGESEATAS